MKNTFVSVVVPFRNRAQDLPTFTHELVALLSSTYAHYEVLFVDNASQDSSRDIMEKLLTQYDYIRYLRLPRPYRPQTVINAALDNVIGDFVVCITPIQDPISSLPELIHRCETSGKALFGVYDTPTREGQLHALGAHLFHWYVERFLKFSIPKYTTGLFVFSRQHLNAFLKIKSLYRYPAFLQLYTGFEWDTYAYAPTKRIHNGFEYFWEYARTATDTIISNSLHPLRVVTLAGFVASTLSFLYVFYVIGIFFLFQSSVAPGWTTLSFQMSIMFFFLFTILTVLSEYVGRILRESQNRPQYFIVEEKTSSALLSSKEQLNIADSSL